MKQTTITCTNCGAILAKGPTADFQEPCPGCGSEKRHKLIAFEELMSSADDDFDALGTNTTTGELVAERVSRARGNTKASVASDAGRESRFIVEMQEKVNNFGAETDAANALAKTLSAKESLDYKVERKDEEDNDVVDRYLLVGGSRVPVQITHLDTGQIAELGKTKKFEDSRDMEELKAMVEKAVNRKSMVDTAVKANTILLLLIPSPLGMMVKKYLQRESFSLGGYKSVWIFPSVENCFEIFEEIPNAEISQKAYLIWTKEGPFWGDDQRHWFQAIDEVRGIQ